MFLLGTLISVNAQVPSYVPSNGLAGWWPFSGNANDVSGNGNNGTVNGATLTTDRFGNPNAAYSFDGINDYIRCTSTGVAGSGSRQYRSGLNQIPLYLVVFSVMVIMIMPLKITE